MTTLIGQRARPDELAGWAALARHHYSSPHWLRFSDTLGTPDSRYWLTSRDGRPVAALSSHLVSGPESPDYTPSAMTVTPHGDAPTLTFGGRKGFLSDVLTDPCLSREAAIAELARLMTAAVDAAPEANERWWWPYLPSADAGLVHAAARRAFGDEAGVHLIAADSTIAIHGASVDDHVAALPVAQRRTNFRREARRFAEAGLSLRRIPLAQWYEQLGPQLANVQQKYGQPQTAAQMTDVLSRHVALMADHAVVFGCFAQERLLGFSLCYRWGRNLTVRAVGFDYEHLVGADEYGMVAVHAPLAHCYESGIDQLHLGMDSYLAKIRRGAVPRPLWAVTAWPGPPADVTEARVAALISDFPEHEIPPFRAEVRSVFAPA